MIDVTQRGLRDPGALPAAVTSFVGRRKASAEVKDELSRSRLVTLTGTGGVGKSRLALHVAEGVQRDFPDGVRLVELAKVQESSLVIRAVMAAFDLRDLSMDEPVDVLVDHLAGTRLLLSWTTATSTSWTPAPRW